MNHLRHTLLVVLCLLAWEGGLYAEASVKPGFRAGVWETQFKIEVGGMPMPMRFRSRKCLTKVDPVPNARNLQGCEVKVTLQTEEKLTWTLMCIDDKVEMKGLGELVFKKQHADGTLNMDVRDKRKHRQTTLLYRLYSDYLGSCDEPGLLD